MYFMYLKKCLQDWLVNVHFRGSRQHYGRLNEYEPEPYIDNEMQDDDDEEDVPGECQNVMIFY